LDPNAFTISDGRWLGRCPGVLPRGLPLGVATATGLYLNARNRGITGAIEIEVVGRTRTVPSHIEYCAPGFLEAMQWRPELH
jgi:hypothetical protein